MGLALTVAALTTPAAAFCRTMSCELGEAERTTPCKRDTHACVTEGRPLHWGSPCLTYAVQVDGSPSSALDADQIQALAAEDFAAWQGAQCPGGGSPRFQAQFQGYVTCDRNDAVCGAADQNVNVIMLHDHDWPYAVKDIGVTTPAGSISSGLMLNADVELNSQDYVFRAGAPDETAVRYVLAHELGHFLGLAHSDVNGALMTEGYQSLPRDAGLLAPDDIAAICQAYPPGPALSCAAPGPAAYDMCPTKPAAGAECKLASVSQDASSCACRAAGGGRPAPALAALGALLAWVRVRRRAKARAKPRR